ncbi:MAG: NUDIX domain-containing protein [Terracoccus sp.]
MTQQHPQVTAARHDAIDRLTRWEAPDEQQEQLLRELLAHVRAHPDGLSKKGPPEHLTASLLVLDDARQRVLLTLHRRARAWFQFGGHIEADDPTLWHAAAREGREESGIDDLRVLPEIVHLDRHVLDGDFGSCREHLDVRFAAIALPDAVPDVSTESLDVRWWPVDALPSGTRDDLTPLVAAALRLSR